MRVRKSFTLIQLFFLITLLCWLCVDARVDAHYILLPLCLILWLYIFFFFILWTRDRAPPVLDIGFICVSFTTLYAVIPLSNFYFGGLAFNELSDGRLLNHAPSARDLGLFFINHSIYVFFLASSYLIFRGNNLGLHVPGIEPPKKSTVRVILFGFLVLSAYFFTLLYFYRIGFRTGYKDDLLSSGPLWLSQINAKLALIQHIFYMGTLAILVYKKDDIRVATLLALFIGWISFDAFAHPGSRGEFVLVIFMTFLFWHKFHGTRLLTIFLLPPAVFLAFQFLGILRSFGSVESMLGEHYSFEVWASATNEFQALLGTAYDVKEMLEGGIIAPTILIFNDIIPLMPPRQVLPFEKLVGSHWYLEQIGHAESGAGFMWGVISQALVGHGMIELAMRGTFLGWFLARVHRWYRSRHTQFLPSVFYFVLCIATILTFRDTTGAILWTIMWSLLPTVVIIWCFTLKRNSKRLYQASDVS